MFIEKAVRRKLERKDLKLGWVHGMAVPHSLVCQDALDAGGDEGELLGSTALICAGQAPTGMRGRTEEPGSH